MRIISGKYRGRRIESVNEQSLRPTMGVAREAIFNILSHGQFTDLLQGCTVLDLFCGCGTLSMEALSRGAKHVVCIDNNPGHLKVAQNNIAHINETDNATFLRMDATTLPPANIKCDLVFIDPPYDSNLVLPTLNRIISNGWLADGAIIIVEASSKKPVEIPATFAQIDKRKYGNCQIIILKKNL